MVSDQDRRELYQALEQQLGGGPAATMMELLPPLGWGDVARQSDLVALRGELKGEMAQLRAELKGEIAELRGEMKTILPKLVAANIGSMIGVAGLVLAAAKLT